MAENVKLSVSESTMRKLLDFTKGEWLTLNSIAKVLGISVETLADWGKQGTFPNASQLSKDGWRIVSRLSLLQWFKQSGTPNADDYATYKQKYFTTRDLADECKIRPDQVLDYVKWGIVKPLSDASFRQFTIEQVDILKAYLEEQKFKEAKSKADAKQKFNDGMKAAYDRMGANQKNKEEMQAEIEARRKASIESEVDNFRKSISGGTR